MAMEKAQELPHAWKGMDQEYLSGSDELEAYIFEELEPIEESKDDMYFFGCKDIFESMWVLSFNLLFSVFFLPMILGMGGK